MNAIVDNKKNEYELTKEFNRLSKTAQRQLNEKYKQDVERGIDVHHAKLQKNWLMFGCIVLHDFMGMTAEECLLFLGNWHEVYYQNSKIETEAEQQAWLMGKMDEIFGVGNYPKEYIDGLEEV
jgi:hypothetical protein